MASPGHINQIRQIGQPTTQDGVYYYNPPIDFKITPAFLDAQNNYNIGPTVYAYGYLWVVVTNQLGTQHPILARIPWSGNGWVDRDNPNDWQQFDLTTISGTPLGTATQDDDHNYYSIGFGADGTIHVSGNMHDVGMRAAVCSNWQAWNQASSWSSESTAILGGGPGTSVSYPYFFRCYDGTLVFLWRDGASSNADWWRVSYGPGGWGTAIKWLSKGTYGGAYWNLHMNASGRFHLAATWQQASGSVGNDSLFNIWYAYSDDNMVTWRRSDGSLYTLPITGGSANEDTVAVLGQSGAGVSANIYDFIPCSDANNNGIVCFGYGTTQNVSGISLTLGATSGTTTVTASGGTPFQGTSADVGTRITMNNGAGSGLISVHNTTSAATITIDTTFSGGTSIGSGAWTYFTNSNHFVSTPRGRSGSWSSPKQVSNWSYFYDSTVLVRNNASYLRMYNYNNRILAIYKHSRQRRGGIWLMDLTDFLAGSSTKPAEVIVNKIDPWQFTFPVIDEIGLYQNSFFQMLIVPSIKNVANSADGEWLGNGGSWGIQTGVLLTMDFRQLDKIMQAGCAVPKYEIAHSFDCLNGAGGQAGMTSSGTGNPGDQIGFFPIGYAEVGFGPMFFRMRGLAKQVTSGTNTFALRVAPENLGAQLTVRDVMSQASTSANYMCTPFFLVQSNVYQEWLNSENRNLNLIAYSRVTANSATIYTMTVDVATLKLGN
jgi:hypothetical protein